jgi:Family of unknown function (DUF5947)
MSEEENRSEDHGTTAGSVDVLRRVLDRQRRTVPGERCDMCATPIPDEHAHVVNVESRNLLCTCRACYLLFTSEGAAQGKFRAVPDRYLYAPSFAFGDAQWDALEIPVRIAFFFLNSSLGRVVAFYPSPAGATESQLPLEAWQEVVQANPVLETLAPDLEALLVYGRRDRSGFDCFLVPIDACYELTGVVRQRWRGFDGGEEAWQEIEAFFTRLREKSREVPAERSP